MVFGFAHNFNVYQNLLLFFFCFGQDVFINLDSFTLSYIAPDEINAADNSDVPSKNFFPLVVVSLFLSSSYVW